jgi:hypothetical protein
MKRQEKREERREKREERREKRAGSREQGDRTELGFDTTLWRSGRFRPMFPPLFSDTLPLTHNP